MRGHDLAGNEARGHRAQQQRCQHHAGGGGRGADHALHEQRHVADRPEHGHADEGHAGDAGRDGLVAQQVEGDDRLRHAPLPEPEERESRWL